MLQLLVLSCLIILVCSVPPECNFNDVIYPALLGDSLPNADSHLWAACPNDAVADVHCDENGHILHIEFFNRNLTGYLPSELGCLTYLDKLDLHKNKLTGIIPESLGSLTMLTVLILQENRLSGTVPESLTALSMLDIFYITRNRLHGPIPTQLSAKYCDVHDDEDDEFNCFDCDDQTKPDDVQCGGASGWNPCNCVPYHLRGSTVSSMTVASSVIDSSFSSSTPALLNIITSSTAAFSDEPSVETFNVVVAFAILAIVIVGFASLLLVVVLLQHCRRQRRDKVDEDDGATNEMAPRSRPRRSKRASRSYADVTDWPHGRSLSRRASRDTLPVRGGTSQVRRAPQHSAYVPLSLLAANATDNSIVTPGRYDRVTMPSTYERCEAPLAT